MQSVFVPGGDVMKLRLPVVIFSILISCATVLVPPACSVAVVDLRIAMGTFDGLVMHSNWGVKENE
jgi:hypothetical protein